VLWGWRRRSAPSEAVEVEGEAIEVTACSGGEAVEGALRRRWRALGVGGGVLQKRVSGKNLLSVERAARAPDIYNGGEMCDTRSLRRIAHFFRHVTHYLYMRDVHLVRRIALLFPMGNMWIPNRRHAPIRRVALLFPMGNTWVPTSGAL
jgi:hypothetical protein